MEVERKELNREMVQKKRERRIKVLVIQGDRKVMQPNREHVLIVKK
jgi:hypothetical protein